MDRRSTQRLSAANAERLLERLTVVQHLRPASTLRDAVEKVCAEEGLTELFPDIMGSLPHDGLTRIGRIGRKELCELAERIETQWQTRMFHTAGVRPLTH